MKLIFSVESQIRRDDKIFIDGRNCGSNLKIGDSFTGFRDVDIAPDSEHAQIISEKSSFDIPVDTSVLSITAYNHSLEELSSGMTARLELSKDIFNDFRGHAYLYSNTG